MIAYRPNKSTPREARFYEMQFRSVREMKRFIAEEWRDVCGRFLFDAKDIVISDEYFFDEEDGDPWLEYSRVGIVRLGRICFPSPTWIGICTKSFAK